jgi:hypothetical protein
MVLCNDYCSPSTRLRERIDTRPLLKSSAALNLLRGTCPNLRWLGLADALFRALEIEEAENAQS